VVAAISPLILADYLVCRSSCDEVQRRVAFHLNEGTADESSPANADRIVDILIWTCSVSVERDGEALHANPVIV